jgi:1-acyl-sn-glycerol-3-phosphate acyltransferase
VATSSTPSRSSRACLALLQLLGWRAVYAPLPGPKGVIMVYPHTSNWDFLYGILFRIGAGLPAQWMGKDTLFRWPVAGLLRRIGGLPIDRRAQHGMTAALLAEYARRDALWIAIAPEGTRSHVPHLKSGFYRLAVEGNLPCGLGFIDYATRSVGIDGYVTFSGNVEQDLALLQEHYAARRGKRHELAGPFRFR